MTEWRKSSFSASADQCVEVAGTLDAVRDSKAGNQVLTVGEFRRLVRLVKDGRIVRQLPA